MTMNAINCYSIGIKQICKAGVQEAAMGLLILEDESREYFATGIPALYEEFKTLYPQSVLMPKLEIALQKNKAFNEAELPERYSYIEYGQCTQL